MYASLISEKPAHYSISVYDVMGRKIYSSGFNVGEGQTPVKLSFNVNTEMYIISVSNGSQTETLKVMGNR
ncbi:MAG: T9SS type A sorting domain-containing protein [Bacteroidetes bacterium]|nr:T9SS type A sorting domain-containing protein [Bacteroidota bacterium]MBL6944639.1 T9SS type A sorting domain-containing protein [Bacteroidales bacterium]